MRRIPSSIVAIVLIGLMMVLFGMTSAKTAGFYGSPNYSIAYGSLNNFDCVNDTGAEAHGFEIELDDIRCVDISYTYDYNHYGVPRITEDLTDPLHPRVFVRYASAKNPDGTWAAYTAIPSGPISATDGHQFTDPSINFGGEHFGVGFNANPTSVKYNWLIDDGSGTLVHGPPVNVSTPTFVYNPPAAGAPANVVAAIVPPLPPAPPVYQFGDACWVNAIKTTSHNPNKVRLQDLVSDDPGFPDPWANGEPDEVENEWRLMQTNFADPNGGPNGELQGAPEDLPGGDEVITRRYEFFKYTGPFDAESGEAVASAVGPDGLHGVGIVTYNDHMENGEWVTVTVDLSTIIVVGDFFGAQMSGFDVAPHLGLIDNIQDGELDIAYPDRRIVIAGVEPFLSNITEGSLPPGMNFDRLNGVLSGTPTQTGAFTFTVQASDSHSGILVHTYTLTVTSGANVGTYNITTASSPVAGGSTTGGGTLNSGQVATLVATPNPGYYFDNWSEAGVHVCFTPIYTFTVNASRDLVANFLPDTVPPITTVSLSGTLGNNGWYLSPVEVTLTATDDLAGIEATYYQVDNGAIIVYAAPFTVSAEGSHTIQYWSRDRMLNVEAKKSIAVNVDGTRPVISAFANPSILKPAGSKMVTVTVSGLIDDLASGVAATSGAFATSDSYGLVEPSGTFTIAANGAYTFTVRLEAKLIATLTKKATIPRVYKVTVSARDLAGNLGSKTVVITVPIK